MENVNFSEGFEGEGVERVLVGRKREGEGYLKAVEEGMKSILCVMDYVRIKKIHGEQVKQDQRFTVLLTVS